MSKQFLIDWGVPAVLILMGVGGFIYTNHQKDRARALSNAVVGGGDMANELPHQKQNIGDYMSCGRCN